MAVASARRTANLRRLRSLPVSAFLNVSDIHEGRARVWIPRNSSRPGTTPRRKWNVPTAIHSRCNREGNILLRRKSRCRALFARCCAKDQVCPTGYHRKHSSAVFARLLQKNQGRYGTSSLEWLRARFTFSFARNTVLVLKVFLISSRLELPPPIRRRAGIKVVQSGVTRKPPRTGIVRVTTLRAGN